MRENEITSILNKASFNLALDFPFWSSLLLQTPIIADNANPSIFSTDNENIYYNPKLLSLFFDRIKSLPEFKGIREDAIVEFLLFHELEHIVKFHCIRGRGKNFRKFNRAADIEIHENMIDDPKMRKFYDLAEKFLLTRKNYQELNNFKKEDFFVEKIYDALPDEEEDLIAISIDDLIKGFSESEGEGESKGESKEESKEDKGKGKEKEGKTGKKGSKITPKDFIKGDLLPSKKRKEEIQPKIIERIQKAIKEMKKGDYPGEFDELIKGFYSSKISWKDHLREFLAHIFVRQRSWFRPNKKYWPDMYLPGNRARALSLEKVILCFDTSGSISTEDLKQFFGEALEIIRSFTPKEVRIITCDAAITYDKIIRDKNEITDEFKVKGRGGTDFRPVFEKLSPEEVKCLIYFTDLMGDFPSEAPPYPVLWVSTDKKGKAPFGRTIYFEREEG